MTFMDRTMRDILNKLQNLEQLSESSMPEIGDEIGFSFSPDFEINTEVVGFLADGIVVELDETAMNMLLAEGVVFLEGEVITEEKQKGVDGKACWKGYKRMGTKQKGGKTVDNCVKMGESIKLNWSNLDEGLSIEDKITIFEEYAIKGNLKESNDQSKVEYFLSLSNMSDDPKTDHQYIVVPMSFINNSIMLLDEPQVMSFIDGTDSVLTFKTSDGVKKYPAESMRYLSVFKTFTFSSVEKYNKFRSIVSLKFDKSLPPVDSSNSVSEAEYQGKEVPLGKKLPGDVKKSKVYVKNPQGRVVKVNFGDKKMRIKKSNPARRKSFRARHNCANPGPRHKARYWSCKSW